jgi:hypothetical protein
VPRYRVYECASPRTSGSAGFHVAIHQENLDRIVVGALLARILDREFQLPRRLHREDCDGAERSALRAQIESYRDWLEIVRVEAKAMGRLQLLTSQELIVLPKILAAETRIAALEEPHPLVQLLATAHSFRRCWNGFELAQQRDVIEALVLPVVDPVPVGERGRRGPNERRVRFVWR